MHCTLTMAFVGGIRIGQGVPFEEMTPEEIIRLSYPELIAKFVRRPIPPSSSLTLECWFSEKVEICPPGGDDDGQVYGVCDSEP